MTAQEFPAGEEAQGADDGNLTAPAPPAGSNPRLAASGPDPYFVTGDVSLYLGDCREVLPALGLHADLVIADPPYGTTAHLWDKWPVGFFDAITVASAETASMWLWLPERELFPKVSKLEALDWTYRQAQVWEKHNGTGPADGRLNRVHEMAWHFTRGKWSDLHKEPPRVAVVSADKSVRRVNGSGEHRRKDRAHSYIDDGTRCARSVVKAPSVRYANRNPTEKPEAALTPLIVGYCPQDGLILDPTAGSGSTLEVARMHGRRAIGIELREEQCEIVARRLQQGVLTHA